MNVDNCPRCGKLYIKGFKDVCPTCLKDIEQMYEVCTSFLRDNRQSSLQELHEETGVPIRQILKFIKEGRISLRSLPNMAYPCEVCGTGIRESNMCEPCRQRLSQELKNSLDKKSSSAAANEDHLGYNIQERLRKRNN